MKYFVVLIVFLATLAICSAQNVSCGGNLVPVCSEQCLFPPTVEVDRRTVQCSRNYYNSCFTEQSMSCTEMRIDDSDFVCKEQTDFLSLCKAMVLQVFPDATVGGSWGICHSNDTEGTLVFTSDSEWIVESSPESCLSLECTFSIPVNAAKRATGHLVIVLGSFVFVLWSLIMNRL